MTATDSWPALFPSRFKHRIPAACCKPNSIGHKRGAWGHLRCAQRSRNPIVQETTNHRPLNARRASRDFTFLQPNASVALPTGLNVSWVSSEKLAFEGKSGEEASRFVRAVRTKAFERGKWADEEWTARFASVYFKGRAKLWYDRLDADVQSDWNALEEMLLECFPVTRDLSECMYTVASPPDVSFQSRLAVSIHGPSSPELLEFSPAQHLSIIIPSSKRVFSAYSAADLRAISQSSISTDEGTTAAAAPLPSFLTPFQPNYIGGGRILIIQEGSSERRYIRAQTSASSWHMTCMKKGDALRVSYSPWKDMHRMTMLNSPLKHLNLGLRWDWDNKALDKPSRHAAYLVGVTDSSPPTSSSPHYFQGPIRSEIWNVFPDGSVGVFWYDENRIRHPLTVALWYTNKGDELVPCTVYLVADFDTFVATRVHSESYTFKRAWLAFDPGV